jgi:hypothetical protein
MANRPRDGQMGAPLVSLDAALPWLVHCLPRAPGHLARCHAPPSCANATTGHRSLSLEAFKTYKMSPSLSVTRDPIFPFLHRLPLPASSSLSWPARSRPALPKPPLPLASPRSTKTPEPDHPSETPLEHRRRRADPPLAATRHGPASSSHLPSSQAHLQVRISPLILFPRGAPTVGDSPHRKMGEAASPALSPPRDLSLKETKALGV